MFTRKEVVAIAVSSLLSVAFAVVVEEYRRPAPSIPHDGPADPHFVSIGRSYHRELGKAYSGAIRMGVTELEAGVPVSTVMADIGKAWSQRRIDSFDRLVTPELTKVVPESIPDADVTPAQRESLAAALRGFAKGVDP